MKLKTLISVKKIFLFILAAVSIYFISCSSSQNCMNNEEINLEYYSEGGFTGGASGITIDSTGNANFWKKNLNSPKENTGSVKLSDEQVKNICSLLKNSDVLSYKSNFSGNYTTYLVLNIKGEENKISFNKSNLPDDMPDSLKELIKELNNIKQ